MSNTAAPNDDAEQTTPAANLPDATLEIVSPSFSTQQPGGASRSPIATAELNWPQLHQLHHLRPPTDSSRTNFLFLLLAGRAIELSLATDPLGRQLELAWARWLLAESINRHPRHRAAQMERTLKSLLDETNQHVSHSINERTLKLAHSIKCILATLTRSQTSPPHERPRSGPSVSANTEMAPDENNNENEPSADAVAKPKQTNEFDWPASFIQLLDALAAKQRQQQTQTPQPTAHSTPTPTPLQTPTLIQTPTQTSLLAPQQLHSISPVSSLAIDDRDFELIALPSVDDSLLAQTDCLLLERPAQTIGANSRLMDIIGRDPDLAIPESPRAAPVPASSPSPLIKFDDANAFNGYENTDRNIINLMKFLCQKSPSEPCFSPRKRAPTTETGNSPATPQPKPRETRPWPRTERWKTLPVCLNRITTVELDQLKRFHCRLPANSNVCSAQSSPRSEMELELKQDFEDENEDSELASTPIGGEGADASAMNKAEQPLRAQTSASSCASSCSATPGAKDDGKYSMLQFALYNFREAIDKYSLDSRTSLRSGRELPAPDYSTLRGSLKLIESLRNGQPAEPSELPSGGGGGGGGGSGGGGGEQQVATNQQASASAVAAGKRQEWTWRELAEMVKFTQTPLRRSLLKLEGRQGLRANQELERRAIDCFAATMRYMGDLPADSSKGPSKGAKLAPGVPESEVECVYLVLINCHNYPELRDEIYCQLIKQTTNNRSSQADSCLRGWRLLSLLAAYFDCSAHFRPYLLNYLEQNAFDKRRAYHSAALLCLQNLRKTFKYGGRKNVPSIEEIVALSAGRISKRQIYRLPGGTERVINTKSTTVVEDIIQEICANMLMVSEPSEMLEFSLYCIADGDLYTMPLGRDEYILDVTTELIKNHQQYFLIFCRSIWHHPLRLDSRLYIELTFNQIAPDYLEGLLLVLPAAHLRPKLLRQLARLAALLHRAAGADCAPKRDEVKHLLPKPIVQAVKQQQQQQRAASKQKTSGTGSEHYATSTSGSAQADEGPAHGTSLQQLVEFVQEFWRDTSALEALDAKAQFLDTIRHWPLFGSSFFAIKLIQRDLIEPTDFILALNKFGIQMLEPQTHETRHKYSFNEVISTRKVRSEDGALFLDLKCGNLMKRTIIRIQTDQAHEISRLIRQYIDIELMQANNSGNNNGNNNGNNCSSSGTNNNHDDAHTPDSNNNRAAG